MGSGSRAANEVFKGLGLRVKKTITYVRSIFRAPQAVEMTLGPQRDYKRGNK